MTPSDSRAPRARTTASAPVLPGLGAVAERYDAFIFDLWGCVHNGVTVFPGVLDALARLKSADRRVLLLSNAPRRAGIIVEQLARNFGVGPELYDAILTSGEVTWQALNRRDDPQHARLGRRCLHIGPGRDLTMFEGNGLIRVPEIGEAEFMLVTGPSVDGQGVEEHEELLHAARKRNLPLVCANPDLEVVRGDTRLVCAGAIAERYEQLGGEVVYHGKPHRVTYRVALDLLGRPARERVLAIGDGPRTDILGAANAGIDSAFIPGGIHGEEFGIRMGETPPRAALAALLERYALSPTYILPEVKW